jgi:sugar/nucleoside kinase (ribokinase family)
MKKRILVVGDVMTDVIVLPDGPMVMGSDRRARIRQRPGGSGANQAVWLGALGAQVTFAGRVGIADHERWDAYFTARGVRPVLAADAEQPSGMLVVLLDAAGERSFLTDRGANLNLAPSDLPNTLLDDVAVLVVSGYSLFEAGPRAAVIGLMARARARNVSIAIDPASVGFIEDVGADAFLGWSAGATLVFANADEAQALTGLADRQAQVRALGAHFGTVVVKCGAAGAVLGDARGIRLERHAPQVETVDSTGAGDAFAAGFLKARCEGADEAACLEAGIAAGARAVATIGGQPL